MAVSAPARPSRDLPPSAQPTETGRPGWVPAVAIAAVAAIALLPRLVGLDRPPQSDEMYNILAARTLVEEGTLRINGGEPYTRALGYTRLLAALFGAFGESLTVARLPGALAGAALVVAVFVWVRSVAGRLAAWAAALPLAFYATGIDLSQTGRFYSLQALAFFLGAVAVYRLADGRPTLARPRAAAWGLLALLALGAATHLQVVTVAGIGGIALWAGAVLTVRLIERRGQRGTAVVFGGVLLALLLLAVILGRSDGARAAWELFRYADEWAGENRGAIRFYHWHLSAAYPTLWTLFPALVLAGALVHARAVTFCALVFGVAFVFHSIAAWKSERYLFYVMPLFFAACGIGIAAALPALRRKTEELLGHAAGGRLSPSARRVAAAALVTAAALFAFAANGSVADSLRLMTTEDRSDWAAAARALRPLADSSEVLGGSSDKKLLYFFRRADVAISSTDMERFGRRVPEFGRVPDLAVTHISTPESARTLVECARSGVLVMEAGHLGKSWSVPPPTAAYLEQTLERIPLPEEWHVVAWRWRHADAAPRPACPATVRRHDARTPRPAQDQRRS